MKLKHLFLMLTLALAGTVFFASCSDDDDKGKGNDNNQSIVGVWSYSENPISMDVKVKKRAPQKMMSIDYSFLEEWIVYGKDNTVKIYYFYLDSKKAPVDYEVDEGTYKISGNTLTETYEYGGSKESYEYTFSVKGKQLKLTSYDEEEDEEYNATYNKKDQKDIDKILANFNYAELIVGAWADDYNPYSWVDDDENYMGEQYDYMVYYSDGTCGILSVFFDTNDEFVKSTFSSGTYTVNDKTIIETYGSTAMEYDLQMTATSMSESYYDEEAGMTAVYTYTRVDKKDIQEYLDVAESIEGKARKVSKK